MLEGCHLLCSWICKDILKESLSHSRVWGSNPQDFTEQAQSRKVVQLEKIKLVIILLKWNAQGKGMILIGFLSYRSLMVSVVRPGYRISSRTIKRGSRVSNLIVSSGVSSNLCILGIIFLGYYFYFIHMRFYILCYFHDNL
jgi:hypothetical protein